MNFRHDDQDESNARVSRRWNISESPIVAFCGLLGLLVSLTGGAYTVFSVKWQGDQNAIEIARLWQVESNGSKNVSDRLDRIEERLNILIGQTDGIKGMH